MRTRMSAVVAVVCILAAAVIAQSARGQLAGKVTDPAGNPLAGATVTLTGLERRTTTSNARGEFAFADLLPGNYQVQAERVGYTPLTVRATVIVGTTIRVALPMTPIAAKKIAPAPPVRVGGALQGGVPGGVVGGVVGGLPEAPAAGVAGVGRPVAVDRTYPIFAPHDAESYASLPENGLRYVGADPLSTFSIDVDTASYANVRRFLTEGRLPPPDAVRVEEMINYFRFDYPQPSRGEPFSITTELAECPWNPAHRLALIGIQGRELTDREPAPRNLVFLLDVSGSMSTPDKLPLVRNAMRMLADVLTPADRVAIVVYAGASGLLLPSTTGDRKDAIHRAIAQLEAGGSTNGGAGITLAYQVAREHFIRDGVNRVILATDGDFNVGVTNQDELVRLIEQERTSGVFLSVLGVGAGNLKDSTMEKLADKGNGNYSYLDSLHEARKVLVREAGATLTTIAKDVKIQVEFNPAVVSAYRLIGYENRALRNEDFNNDRKDAGEMGAGHSVTALYEIIPVGVDLVDPLKYQPRSQLPRDADTTEAATVKVRYKAPGADVSRLTTTVVRNTPRAMTANLAFASAVAEFGMLLRGSEYRGNASYEAALARARAFRGSDPEGYRAEFVRLVDLASGLKNLSARR
jgi:Ca-activated chloride channel family protein